MVSIPARLWLVFFGPEYGEPRWWHRFLHPGFRHISAAAFYPEGKGGGRWVYYDPGFEGTLIEVWKPKDFGARLGDLLVRSTIVLRCQTRFGRQMTSRSWYCVGAIKALLGINSRALLPYTLHLHLLRDGAKIVEIDRGIIAKAAAAETASGARAEPRTHAAAKGRAGTRGRRAHQGHSRSAPL